MAARPNTYRVPAEFITALGRESAHQTVRWAFEAAKEAGVGFEMACQWAHAWLENAVNEQDYARGA
jgi:hypothetical protein